MRFSLALLLLAVGEADMSERKKIREREREFIHHHKSGNHLPNFSRLTGRKEEEC